MRISESMLAARVWLSGCTLGQELRFYRGVMVGMLVSVILVAVVCLTHRGDDREVALEVARRFGYSSCCMDTMAIVLHGGGLDEIIAFMRAKGETEFSPMVSPTNFFIEASASVAGLRRKTISRIAQSGRPW